MKILIIGLLLLAGCAPVSMDKYIEAMSKDPADLKFQGAYMGGSVSLERSMPKPSACK